MDIGERNTINFSITTDEMDTSVLNFTFTDGDSSEAIGTLRISKNRMRPFAESMNTIFRELHDVFQAHLKASTRLNNKSNGHISFVEAN